MSSELQAKAQSLPRIYTDTFLDYFALSV